MKKYLLALTMSFAVSSVVAQNVQSSDGGLRNLQQQTADAEKSVKYAADLYYLRGSILAVQFKFDEAMAAYRRALELDPDHAAAKEQLAQLEKRPK